MNLLAEPSPVVSMPAATPTTFRMISNHAELQALVPAWRDLLRRSVSDEPMLSPEWLLTWWDIYGQGRELQVGCWERDSDLVGLALMHRRRRRYRLGLSFRRLEPLGSDGDEGDGVCSDYLNLIASAGEELTVARDFVRRLQANEFGRWDEWMCSRMDGEHPMSAALQTAFAEAGFVIEREAKDEAPYVALPESWEAYLATLNKKRRQSLTYAMRDFKAWAGDDFRVRSVESAADLPIARKVLADLHRERWQAEGSQGVFASPRFATFHERFQEAALQRGQLELTWIEVRGEAVAVHYSFVANGKLYFYQTGRKTDVPDKVRLGIVQVVFGVRKAIEGGLREFDFLPGVAQYKSLFASGSRPVVTFRVARPSWKESLRRGLKWTAAQLRERMSRIRRVNQS
ncbi:MAG: GNAT family N-acetyltransferase [Gemmataceae bacterium]|nr:GNAT family N-acetyltransferase [Gemmataceae bacterium]